MNSRWGGFLNNVEAFDANFFGIFPRKAEKMDPQQRLLLEVTWEALENASINAQDLAGSKTGTLIGMFSHDYSWNSVLQPETIDAHSANGMAHCIAANRISNFFDLKGFSMAIDTACSSSALALHLACRSLRDKENDLMVVGGVNLILNPISSILLSKTIPLSPTGRCRTFDQQADGTVRSEGCGILILKRLSEALAEGDHIWAQILGTASNQDGRSSGLANPNVNSQCEVIEEALWNAQVTPQQISLVEASGTGTPVGDSIEVEALSETIGQHRADQSGCALAAVKTNIGHTEGASAALSIIKVALALNKRQIPAHLHFTNLNSRISLEKTPFYLPQQLTPWNPIDGKRIAALNSFGLGGTNVHVILSEVPALTPVEKDETWPQLFTLSAKTEKALQDLMKRYLKYLMDNPTVNLSALCRTLNGGRARFPYRLAFPAKSIPQVYHLLEEKLTTSLSAAELMKATEPLKFAFFFADNESQAEDLPNTCIPEITVLKPYLDEVESAWNDLMGTTGIPVFPRGSQPLQFSVDQKLFIFSWHYAIAHLFMSWGIQPSLLQGNGVGEFLAAHFSGILSLEDALALALHKNPIELETRLAPPKIRVLSNTTGQRLLWQEAKQEEYWIQTSRTRLSTTQLNQSIQQENGDLILAIGTRNSLISINNLKDSIIFSLIPYQEAEQVNIDLTKILGQLFTLGSDLNFQQQKGVKIPLPSYPFQRKNFPFNTH